ncbi:MAG: serine/threonine-protein kinase [Polyangiales bacterium]
MLERVALHGEKLEPEVAVGIVARVASALDYAHTARDARRASLGVVHRDVSPHNLMVRFDGVVKLLDFGVAKVAQSEDESRSDAVKGKFGYLAPEQCRAESVDGRADVFALGVCLWEAITGRRLYKRGSQFDTFRAILEEPPPSIRELDPSLPEDLDEIVRKALAKEPGNRFAAAGEMQEALEQWISNRGAIVTAARLRRAMGELFADEIRSGPRLEADTKVRERLRATSVHPPLSTSERPPPPDAALDDAPAAEAPSRPGWVLPVAAIVLLAALGAGAFFALRSPEPTGPAQRLAAGRRACRGSERRSVRRTKPAPRRRVKSRRVPPSSVRLPPPTERPPNARPRKPRPSAKPPSVPRPKPPNAKPRPRNSSNNAGVGSLERNDAVRVSIADPGFDVPSLVRPGAFAPGLERGFRTRRSHPPDRRIPKSLLARPPAQPR